LFLFSGCKGTAFRNFMQYLKIGKFLHLLFIVVSSFLGILNKKTK